MDWREEAQIKLDSMPQAAKDLKAKAEANLFTFAKLLNPGYMYGDIHKEAFDWLQEYMLFGDSADKTANKLLMFPRAHLKSHCMAVWATWVITRHPEITILYLSATSELAEIQLYSIKSMMTSDVYRRYWPEYINPQEGGRAKWTERKIIIDHMQRKTEGIRDATVATAGLSTNTTGWHADIIIPDDLVIPENAYTEDGRSSVRKKSSQFTSIRNAGGFTLACGTRYHPSDIYATWKKQTYEVYDESTGDVIEIRPVWEVMERVVESDGIFLWPRIVRKDGKAFGFNMNELSRIKAEYEDRIQFYAQYYNDPNDPGSERISRDKFQYFDPRFVKWSGNRWTFKDTPINVYASIDFAFSLNKRADYSAIVVIGIDPDGNIYVLDIDRFKTDKTSIYFKHIIDMHSKWYFKKMRAEVTVAQQIIVNDIKDSVRKHGMRLSIDEYRPSRHEGSKEERMAATLERRYDDLLMWHYNGGYTPVLEDELILARPAHDDVKDSLANAIAIAVKPKRRRSSIEMGLGLVPQQRFNKFGGVQFK